MRNLFHFYISYLFCCIGAYHASVPIHCVFRTAIPAVDSSLTEPRFRTPVDRHTPQVIFDDIAFINKSFYSFSLIFLFYTYISNGFMTKKSDLCIRKSEDGPRIVIRKERNK